MDEHELAELVEDLPPELDDGPPELADELKATRVLAALGHEQARMKTTTETFDAYEAALEDRLQRVRERRAEVLAPMEATCAELTRWLEGWHRAQLSVDSRGKVHRLTVSLPTGTLKMAKQQPRIDLEDAEAFMKWATERAPDLVIQPDPVIPPPRPDKRLLNTFVADALANLPDQPEPGIVPLPIPGVEVEVRDRKFTVTPDI